LFISSTLAYLVYPQGTPSQLFTIGCTVTIFWGQTLLALRGLHTSARFASFCAIIGMIMPMAVIICLGVLWIALGHPSAIGFHYSNLIPHIGKQDSWISLTAIMTSFLGMELAAVHVRQINDPQKIFPKAILYSVILILVTMILGSLSIAMVLPKNEINLVIGVLQTGSSFLKYHHLEFFMPVFVALIFIGSIGSMVNWILAPAQGLAFSAHDEFLPKWFAKTSQKGIPHRILILQAIVVTALCLSFLLMPNMNAMYWFFTSLSTELYMCMYVLMFLAAIVIKKQYAHIPRRFQIPGKRFGYYSHCLLGLIGCSITLYIGFFPPQEALTLPHPELYKLYFGAGLMMMILPALLRLAYKKILG
jgi:glutamate:GABA antiporter